MPSSPAGLTPRRGRPRKFSVPASAVTLTLPENVIDALSAVDLDLSRAVVRVVQPEMKKRPHPPAELLTFGRRAVIVVNPTRTLEEYTGIRLIPLSDGRALISFDESMTIARLELLVQDALEGRGLSEQDGRIFESIRDLLKTARRSGTVSVEQRSIIVFESNRGRMRQASAGPHGRRGK